MNSRLVIADAAETKLCAWLSVSTLAGLATFGRQPLSDGDDPRTPAQ